MSTPLAVCPQAGLALQLPFGTQQAGPCTVHGLPQLSRPGPLVPQAMGPVAVQLPLGTQHCGPVRVHSLPQLSTPRVVCSQAGAAALQLPSGVQPPPPPPAMAKLLHVKEQPPEALSCPMRPSTVAQNPHVL